MTVTKTPAAGLVMSDSFMGRRSLTGIRRRKRRIAPSGHGRVFVAFPAVFVAVCAIMTPKTFPAKTAFVVANPKA